LSRNFRHDSRVFRDESERHVAFRAKKAAAFLGDVTLRLELGDLFLQGRNLGQLGALLAIPGKRRGWCLGCLRHPSPQYALGQFQIPARLGDRNAPLRHQLHHLD